MHTDNAIQLHWSPCLGEHTPDASRFIEMCQGAEAAGAESVHLPIASCLTRALELALIAARETTRIRFRIGWDFGEVIASLRGRDLKKAFDDLDGRLIVHLRLDGTEFSLNGNLPSASEFITNFRALFEEFKAPDFDVEGETAEAAFLAIKHGDCLWRFPHQRSNQIYADALPVLHFGKEVGLVCSAIARETRAEALEAASSLMPENGEERREVIIGSFEEVARALFDFKRSGISRLLIRELPGREELIRFGTMVKPIIRMLESGQAAN